MRIETGADPGELFITLSERNLLTLLAKLYEDDSHRTIGRYLSREFPYAAIYVRAEHDDEHYGDREPGEIRESTAHVINTLKRIRHQRVLDKMKGSAVRDSLRKERDPEIPL